MSDDKQADDLPDDISDSEMYRAIDKDFVEDDFDGEGTTLIGEMHGNLLPSIEAFVDDVASSDEVAFEWEGNKLKPLRFARYFKLMPGLIRQYDPRWTYSAKVQRFFKASEELLPLIFRAPEIRLGDRTEGEFFNDFIKDLRATCRSEEFKEELRQQSMRTNRRLKSVVKYVNKLFAQCSRILVVRIDFLYRGEGPPITLERLLKDFSTLVNNRRHNKIFEHEIGYIRRLEYGARDHHHVHAFFFFDGSKVRNDPYWPSGSGSTGSS